jgi:hypothetical protein
VDENWEVRISPFRLEAQIISLIGPADGFPFRWEALSRLPPELYEGKHPTSATYNATGQYYLGLLGLELLRGRPPVQVRCLKDLQALSEFHLAPKKHFTNPRDADPWPERNPALAFVIARLLEQGAEKRYAGAEEVVKELAAVVDGEPPPSAKSEARLGYAQLADAAFADRFYKRLLAMGGERMRFLFRAVPLQEQHQAFIGALAGFDSYDPEGYRFKTMIEKHRDRGILPADVDVFRRLLIQEIEATLGGADRQREAWRVLLHRPFMDLRARVSGEVAEARGNHEGASRSRQFSRSVPPRAERFGQDGYLPQ